MLGSLARAPGRWGHIRPVRSWTAARRPALSRVDRAVAALALASTALRLLTYLPYADGSWPQALGAVAFGVALTLLLWLWLRRRLSAASPWPALAALFVLWCGDAVHLLRRTHPLARSEQIVLLREDFSPPAPGSPGTLDPERWLANTRAGGTVEVADHTLVLRSAPGTAASVDLRLERIEQAALWPWAILPEALQPVEHAGWLEQRLTWTAAAELAGDYYVAVELVPRKVLVQVVPWGLSVTAPDSTGTIVEKSVALPDVGQGATHTWRLEQSPARVAIQIDDTVLWEGPAQGTLGFVRFGDARAAPEHAGSLSIRHVVLTWQRPDGS